MAPLKVALVGGGPSAFYVASRLLQLLPPSSSLGDSLRIHLYDRLWAPHGLVRYGVAPDHPEVKNCTHKFNEAALDPRLSFFGNINISSVPSPVPQAVDVSLQSLFPHYTHLVLSSGCTVPRLHPALPPSTHCRPALDLVHWYTQHPAQAHRPPPALDKIEHVTVIGHGNVSLDIARMLLAPVEHLEKYDVPERVLDVLRGSRVKHVSIVGRRGPTEASFTTKELREMMTLPNASLVPLQTGLFDSVSKSGEKLTRQQTRLLDLLKKGSTNKFGSTLKTFSIDFFRSPTGISSAPPDSRHTSQLSLAHTVLDADKRAVPSGESSQLSTDLVVTSLGYRAEPTHEWYEPALGHVRNVGGRVVGADSKVLKNVYTSGWAATGAKGVLASTMLNAHATVDTILSDLRASTPGEESTQTGPSPPPSSAILSGDVSHILSQDIDLDSIPEDVKQAQKNGLAFDYRDWEKIDVEEVRRGAARGKERERMDWEAAKRFLDR